MVTAIVKVKVKVKVKAMNTDVIRTTE